MSNEKILIIEDERDIVKLLKYNLEKESFRVVTALDGETGLIAFRKEKPDFVLLDLMLPAMDGHDVCRAIRQESKVPIMMLTAKREELDRILGLELGADDYVTKPFSVREVMARIKVILRRVSDRNVVQNKIQSGSLEIDLEAYHVTVDGKAVRLSPKEFEFLKCLILAKGKAIKREDLMEQVWGQEAALNIDTRTVDQHIARMRDKLGPEAKRILTIQNVGYRFKLD